MTAKSNHRKSPVQRKASEPFDDQVTFQLHRHEKLAALSLIDGRRFKYQGDVFREFMYFYFEQHQIDPEEFRTVVSSLANQL